jgi:hypothetical protein
MSTQRRIGKAIESALGVGTDIWQAQKDWRLAQDQEERSNRELDESIRRTTAQIDHWESQGLVNAEQANALRIENELKRLFLDSTGSGRSPFDDPTREEQRSPYESITPDPTASILRGRPGSLSYDLYGDQDDTTHADDTTQTPVTPRRRVTPSVSDSPPVTSGQVRLPSYSFGRRRTRPVETGPMRQEAPGVARPQPTVGDQPAMNRPLATGRSGVDLTMQGQIRGNQNPFSNLNQDTRQRIGYDMMGWPNAVPPYGQRPDELAARLQLEDAIRRQSELEQIPAVAAQKGMVGDVPLHERRYQDPVTGQEMVEIRTQPQVARSLRRGGSEIYAAPLTQAQQTVMREMAPTVQSLVTIESILPHFEDRASANVTGLGSQGAIGPLAGPVSQLRTLLPGWTGLDDDLFNRMNVEVYTLLNNTVRMITGAQMSNPEAARIKKQVPSINDRLSVFKEKLRATQANVRAMGEANRMNIELDDYYRMNPHVWRPEGIVGEEATGEISITGLGDGSGAGNGGDQYLIEEVVR